MKEPHPTDGFQLSEAAFVEASEYWQKLFTELGVLPHRGWRVISAHRLLNGSFDIAGGVLFKMENIAAKKTLRLSQSEKNEKGFVLMHTSEVEIEKTKCIQLNVHCSPTKRIEGLIGLVALGWLSSENKAEALEGALNRFLPHEVFEEEASGESPANDVTS